MNAGRTGTTRRTGPATRARPGGENAHRLFGRTPGGGVFVIDARADGTGMAAPRLDARNFFRYITTVS